MKHIVGFYMSETEFKGVITGSVDEVVRIIEEDGFRRVDTCVETDVYYDHPCRNMGASDEALRLRRRKCGSGEYVVLTYKGPRHMNDLFKTREEVEVFLPEKSLREAERLLDSLGFKKIMSFTKARIIFRREGLEASVDELLGVGHFVEIEVKDPGHMDGAKRLLTKLSSLVDPVAKTYLEICFEKKSCRA